MLLQENVIKCMSIEQFASNSSSPRQLQTVQNRSRFEFFLTIRLQTCVVLPCSSWKQQYMEKPPELDNFLKKCRSGLLFYHWGPLFLNDNLPHKNSKDIFLPVSRGTAGLKQQAGSWCKWRSSRSHLRPRCRGDPMDQPKNSLNN